MELQSELPEVVATTEPGGDMDHFVCLECHPEGDVLLCGLDGTAKNWEEDGTDSVECVVCDSMESCPDCGEPFYVNEEFHGIFDEWIG